jgi:hypothetical protein
VGSSLDTDIELNLHGQYDIQIQGRILLVDATGPFNEAIVKSYLGDLQTAVETLAPEPWALLAVFHDVSLFTPEAEAELIRVTRWRVGKGLSRCALTLIDIVGAEIVKDQLSRIYAAAGLEFEFFERIDDARQWLENQGHSSH